MLTRPRTIWLPWVLFALAVLIAAMEIVVSLQNTEAASHHVALTDWLVGFEVSLPPITFTAVGAFVLTRRPGNRIGWLLILIGLGFAFGSLTADYPDFSAQTHRATRPFSTFVTWIGTWNWTAYLMGLLLLLLLFPTGELPGRRWKAVMWIGVGAFIAATVLNAVQRGPINDTGLDNPFGLITTPGSIVAALVACGLVAMAAALLSLVLRFRTARGDVRQQLKWFTYGAALTITFVLAAFATSWSNVLALFAVASLAALPIFIGVAILRYRLYDIDVLVNRTLVYGSLTASLALLYFGEVILLQTLFRSVTGQQSEVAIALSTLGIAALFQPLRRRIQRTIDHRFYRRKYDAARTLVAFQDRLRDEVDLDRLTGDLLGVVQETIQPAHVSLWLRQE